MKKFSSITRESSRRTSRNRKTLYFGLFCATLIFLFTLVPSVIGGLAQFLIYPIDAATSWIRNSQSTLPTYLRDRSELNTKIQELEQLVAEGAIDDQTLHKLQTENVYLRGLMGNESSPRILAEVVSRPPELPYDLLLIDEGSDQGVRVGAPVFVGGGQIIGIVSHTTKTSAFIELITSPGFESTVFIYGPDIFTRAEGYGGGVLRIRVPQGIDIAPNNLVIVPALDSGIFGTISYVQTSPTQPEQYGFVVPKTPLQSIHTVSVDTRPVTEIDFETANQIVSDNRIGRIGIDIPASELIIVPEPAATSTATTTNDGTATSSLDISL